MPKITAERIIDSSAGAFRAGAVSAAGGISAGSIHVLATTAGLGDLHSVFGLSAGQVLKATGSATAAFAQLQHGDLSGITADQHHAQSHVLASTSGLGGDHTVSGLTARQVLRATSDATAAFGAIEDADLPSTIVRTSRTLTAGDGLSGLGDLSANRTVNIELSATSGLELAGSSPDKTLQIADTVAGNGLGIASKILSVGVATTIQAGAGAGLSVEANAVRLTAGYDPGANTSILASDATGKLTLPFMVASTSLTTPLLTTASGDLTIDPAGVVKFPIAQTLKTADFNSDFPILGWQINENPAIAGQSALTIGAIAADELHVKIFVADETRVDRGDEYWTKSYGIVAETFTTPSAIGGTVTVVFEDSPALEGEIFSVNDWLLFRQVDIDTGFDLATIWGQVSGYTDLADGLQSWTFTLRSGDTLKEIKAGSLATDFGATNAGLIHLSTIDVAGAPYIKMRRWSGANPYEPANYTTYVQIGNLDSVSNASLPAPSGYGLYVRSGTADRGIIIDDNGVLIQGADLKLYNGATQTVNLSYTGTDFWIGPSSLDKRFVWDGSALSITGSIYATAGYIGGTTAGWAIEAGKLSSTNIELLSGASARLQVGSGSDIAGVASTAAGTDVAFWAGDTYANRATADFRLTAAGALYATTGTIAGDFTVTSPGRIIAGGGHVIASVSGLDISSYDYDSSPNPNPTENVRSIAWWPDAATKSPTDTPDARIWGGRGANGERIIQFDVDPVDGTAPRMWLQKSVQQLGFVGIKSVWGLPGLSINESASIATVTIGETSRFILNPTSTFLSYTHLKTAYVNAAPAYDIGEAGTKWRTIYVGHIEADTISGTSLSGATWRHDAANMGIYSSSTGTRTLTIANDGDGVMNVEIDGGLLLATGNITLNQAGATVDGVDLSSFYAAYGSHSHAWSAITGKPSTFAPSAHALVGGDHTASGLTAGQVVRASGATTFAWAQLAHSDLGSIDSDTHVAHSGVSILGGNGLTGGGAINSTQTLHVAVSGLGLSVSTDAVTLSSSSAGEANAHILATNASGGFSVSGNVGVGAGASTYKLNVVGSPGTIATFGTGSQSLYILNGLNLTGATESTLSTITSSGASAGPLALGAGNTEVVRITTSSNVGINKTDPIYALDVTGTGRFSSTLYAGDDLDVYDMATVGGNLTVGTYNGGVLQVDSALHKIGINRAADSQFSLDIAGAARAEYWVGPHALQLDGAVAIMHFDGAAPYNKDFSGTPDTHMGVRGTPTGHVLYRPGMFGKAVQVAEATKNLLKDTSFELYAYTYWSAYYAGVTSWSSDSLYGSNCARFSASTNVGVNQSVSLANGTYTFSAWIYLESIAAGGLGPAVYIAGYGAGETNVECDRTRLNQWQRISITFAVTSGAVGCYLLSTATCTWRVDGVQLEAKDYATPYHDGDMTATESWDDTAHVSTSTRTAARLTYPGSLLSTVAGTIGMWVQTTGTPADYAAMNNGNGACQFSAGGVTRSDIWVGTPAGTIAQWNGTSLLAVYGATWTPGDWLYIAFTWDSAGRTIYCYTPTQKLSATDSGVGIAEIGTTFDVGTAGGSYWSNSLIDDFIILDRAAPADEILSIYASRAPVFAESSVFSFRAPTKSNLRVDEYGLWFSGLSDQAIFGMYGGDPARVLTTQSWGGVTMEEGDVVIGRTTDSGAALHWDDSERKLRLGVQSGNHLELTSTTFKIKAGAVEKISLDSDGNASITGALAMGASGSITATNTIINSTGVSIVTTNTWDSIASYKFKNSSNTLVGGVFGLSSSTHSQIAISANLTTPNSITPVETGRNAVVEMESVAKGSGTSAIVALSAGNYANDNSSYQAAVISMSSQAEASSVNTSIKLYADELLFNSNTVWHAGNDGHGGGLDADTLDTYEASAFGRLAAANTWSAAQTIGVATASAGALTVRGSASNASLNHDSTVYASFGAYQFVQLAISGMAASPFSMSIQVKHELHNGYLYPLVLNPLGGNVGVGNSNPGYALDVTGTFAASGLITATGGINSLASMKATATYFDITQMSSAPGNPASGTARLYVTNVGDGRRQLTIKFADGSVHNFISSTTSA